MKTLTFLSLFLCLTFATSSFGQCLTTNGIGGFEDNSPLASWFTADEGNGAFLLETTDVYAGNTSLKVDVTTNSGWKVRMFNRPECNYDLVQGEAYTLSLAAKGAIGANITLTLMDNLTNDAIGNIVLTSSDWTVYELELTASISSTSGRLKLNFTDAGTYLVDNIVLGRNTNNWHVSPNGANNLNNDNGKTPANPLQTLQYAVNNAWEPGDTILVMNGTYQNAGYGNGSKNNGPVLNLSTIATGEASGWLVIKNYPSHQPKIQFDGAGGIIGNNQTYLDISGFEIEGPNQNITYNEAFANRLIQDKYYSGRGIAIWSGHHINIHHNKIHDCPNSGIRTNNGDYTNIYYNEVYNNTWWSSNAESAIVYATALDIDTLSIIKMTITNNLVYDNYNNIPYYNSTYTGETSDYGTAAQDYIIDGSGCYVTRNRDTYFYGWFYFANNICYGNGINGLVVHKTDRAIVTNNTCYRNGAVPLSSGRQAASGITINGSDYVRMYNNISWPRLDTDYGYKVYNWGDTEFLEASNNILAKGLSDFTSSQYTFADPLFVDAANNDFTLQANSPAIESGLSHPDLPLFDYADNPRDPILPDLGALEYIAPTVRLNARLLLGGNYDANSGLMQDNLRSSGQLPLTDPFMHLPNYEYPDLSLKGITISDSMTVLSVAGPTAIVDWVFIELRDAVDPSILIAARAALLNRQGDLVEVDGIAPIQLKVPSGEYHVSIRHRNHLKVTTIVPVLLDENSTLLDFTAGNASNQVSLSGKYGLFSGDVNGDSIIDAADRSATWNNRNKVGYMLEDTNLDGFVDAADRSTTWNNRNQTAF